MGDMASARNHLGGVQFAQVAVDTETGRVRVERIVAVHDCGRPINPLQLESQIHGGVLQGISYALFERRVLDRATGHMLNANLEQYKVLRARELPAIEVVVLENYQGMSATDAYGVAEPATIPTAPAVANAVYNAIGVRMRELPITPDKSPRGSPRSPATELRRMNRFEWTSPQTLAQALEMRMTTTAASMLSSDGQPASGAAILKAGGIDLLGLMKDGLLQPARIVNLQAIAELGQIIQQTDGTMRVGANVTLAQIASDQGLRTRYPALADAAGNSASPQLRQVATIGGNLLQRPRCWYFRSLHHHCARKGGATCFAFGGENEYHAIFGQEGCAIVHPSTAATALVALAAKVELASGDGTRRIVALEKFFVAPATDIRRENDLRSGEILTAVLLPATGPRVRSVHLREGELESFDWPIADVAVVLDSDVDGQCRSASVVLGAAAPVPYRAKGAEAALTGRRVSDETARRAAQAALTGATPLEKNAYKVPVFEALVRRAIIQAAGNP